MVIHCGAGVGRMGVVEILLLMELGLQRTLAQKLVEGI